MVMTTRLRMGRHYTKQIEKHTFSWSNERVPSFSSHILYSMQAQISSLLHSRRLFLACFPLLVLEALDLIKSKWNCTLWGRILVL